MFCIDTNKNMFVGFSYSSNCLLKYSLSLFPTIQTEPGSGSSAMYVSYNVSANGGSYIKYNFVYKFSKQCVFKNARTDLKWTKFI